MSLHPDTIKAIKESKLNFSPELATNIDELISLSRAYSSLSDINYILHRTGKKLPRIKLPQDPTWVPTRNLIRLIAYIGKNSGLTEITEIDLESMMCGCDYFEGYISLKSNGTTKLKGPYKWQWTAFPNSPRNFDRFTVFPKVKQQIAIE